MVDVSQGELRYRAWPTPRGKPKTKEQREAQELFRTVQKAAQYFAPEMLAYIYKATANSPLLVRDVVTMQLYGRWLAITLDSGRQLYPMTAINEVSEALDVLGNAIGAYLVRHADGWRASSTLPLASPHMRQATIRRSANLAQGTGNFERLPFDQVLDDPEGWWVGNPDFGWRPDTPGFYYLRLTVRRTAATISRVWMRNLASGLMVADGADRPGGQTAQVSAMLYLDGATTITSGGNASATGTVQGGASLGTQFSITGPF